MPGTTDLAMIGRADGLARGPGLLTPEVQSLVDTVIRSVLDWAAQQTNSNRDSNSLGGTPIPSIPSDT